MHRHLHTPLSAGISLANRAIFAAGIKRRMRQLPVAVSAMVSASAAAQTAHDIQADAGFTNINSNGSVHAITSKVTSGSNAINVFNKFVVGSNNTVNLTVPDTSSQLVNIVRGTEAPAVHGILNSYQNGTLGGNVVFASSAGFLVGETGVVNVGKLSIRTPDDVAVMFDDQGAIIGSQVTNLLNGNLPVSSTGAVTIRGKINTAAGVDINANTISVDGAGKIIAGRAAQTSGVSLAAVNVDDLTVPTELLVDGGTITLKAASSNASAINLSGDLYADGGFTFTANDIAINAGSTIDARDADNSSAAGTIAFNAAGNTATSLSLNAAGQTIVVEASTTSSPETANDGITLVGDVTSDGAVTVTADTFKTNASSTVDAVGMLTVNADSHINVSGTLAAEGGIDLDSKDIDLNSGSLLDTRNADDSARGDVVLDAKIRQSLGMGTVASATNIDLSGEIKAGNVTAHAKSVAISSFYEEIGLTLSQISTGIFAGASFYVMDADAEATLNVHGTANINASGNVSLRSESHAATEATSFTAGNLLPASLALIYATSDATSKTHVKTGATIEAGGDMDIVAHNEAYLSASAFNVSAAESGKVALAAAVGKSDVDATAIVDSGVTLDANNLLVAAENQNYYYVSATAYGLKNNRAGLAVAVGDFDTNATAELGSSIGKDDDKVGNVTVAALDRTLNQRVHSGVTVGDSLFMRTVGSQFINGVSAMQTGVNSLMTKYLPTGQSVPTDSSGKVSFKAGLAFTLNLSDHDAYSYVGTNTPGQTDAPKIKASGNMLVVSQTDLGSDNTTIAGGNSNGSLGGDQGGYRTSAEAAVNSPSEQSGGTGSTPASEKSLALAINLAINDSDAVAEVGESVHIDAANLAVIAAQHMPIVSTYDQWDSFSSVISKFNGMAGLQNNILTSFANAGATGDTEAYGGSVNVVINDMDTKAWIGDNAKVTTTGTSSWSASRQIKGDLRTPSLIGDNSPFKDITYNFSFDDSVTVSAYNLMESINMAGNIGALGLGAGGGTNKSGKAIGGSVSYIQQTGSAVAGVGTATINATGNVGIYAETDERHFVITPSSGIGKGVGFNGVVGILNSEVLTHASLSNAIQLTADKLNITAGHTVGNWVAAGAFNWSDQSAVGISVATNISQGDTKAFIGDNSKEYNKVKFEDSDNNQISKNTPSSPTAPTPTKGIVANAVTVRGRATGTNGSLAVAGALTTEPSDKPGIGTKFESWYNGLSSKVAANYSSASSSDSSSSTSVNQASSDGANDNSNSSGNSSANVASTGLAGAGSFSVSVNNLDAKAMIDGASISGHSNGSGYNDVDVDVQSLSKIISATATGSAALSLLGAQSPTNQNTIAGAISYQISFNDSLAWVTDSVITHTDDVNVQALQGGELTSVALALSVTKPAANSLTTNNGAVSISGAQIYNGTSARITGSSIDANDGANNDLEVSAYDNAYVGVGGGTLYGGGKQGAGLAITFAEINDPSAIPGDANPDGNNVLSTAYDEDVYDGEATEAIVQNNGSTRSYLSGFDRVDISARSLNRIGIGAAGIGYNNNVDNSLGFQGSFAIGSIGADTKTRLKGTNISDTGIVTVNASGEKDGDLDSILSGLGSSDLNKDYDFSGVDAIDNTNVHTSEDGSGSTYSYSSEGKRIIAVAGVVQVGKKNLGISYAHADVKSDTTARIEDTNINQSGSQKANVSVNARDNSLLYSVAMGVGVGTGGFSGVGSVAVNRLNNKVLAEIGNWDGSDQGIINASGLSVVAQNDMDMINVAGSVAIASGQDSATAGGLAVALNLVGTDEHSTKARISNTTLNVDENLTVKAFSGTSNDHNLLVGNAIAIGASTGQSGLAFAGAITVNNIDQTIEAGIKDTGTNRTIAASSTDGGDVLVKGQDYTDSVATAWMGAGSSGGSSFGIATATNRVDSDVTAEIIGDSGHPGSTTLKAKNVIVDAHRRNWLLTIDAGVAASKQIAFAPSIGTGVIDGNVKARIANDVKIEAWNNVAIQASARSVNLVGSGAVGIGVDGGAGAVAVSTALEYGKTEAFIDDAVIVAKGLGANYDANSGRLKNAATSPDLSTAGEGTHDSVSMDDLTTGFAAHSMEGDTEKASGLIVTATNYQKQRAITVGGSGSKNVAITANVATTSVDSETLAYISNSEINKGYTPTAESDVLVRGANHSFGLSVSAGVALAVGGEGGAAGIAGFSTNRESKDTTAKIISSEVYADAVTVEAISSKVAQAVSAGVAAGLGTKGGIGGAASVVITEQNGNTTARVYGGTVTANSLAVNAETRQESNIAAGSAGIGTTVGVGVGLALNLMGGDTKARIGRDDGSTSDTTTTTVNANDVDVLADRLVSVNSYAFGAGIGASSAGVAAMVDTTEVTGETRSGIYGGYHNSAYTTKVRGKDGASKATTLDVRSQEILYANQITAGLGVGASVGVGAVANVLLGRSQAYSEIVGSEVKAATLNVKSDTLREAELISVSGAGGQYSAAISIGLILMGQGDSTTDDGVNAEDEFGDSRTMANNALAEDYSSYNPHLDADDSNNNGGGGSVAASSSSSDSNAVYAASGNRLKLKGESVTAARISGGIIEAGTLNVNADARLYTYQGIGAAQASAVGIAGGIGVSRLYDMAIATVDAGVTADNITVSALTRNKSDEKAAGEMKNFVIGVAGTAIGISYSDVRSKHRVVAGLSRAISSDTTNDAGTLVVSAKDTTELRIGDTGSDVNGNPENGGMNIQVGAGAVGVSIGIAEKDSDVDAWLGLYDDKGTSSTGDDQYSIIDGFSSQTVEASVSGMVSSTAFAAAGGILAGVQGVVTDARDKSDADAVVYGRIGTGNSGTLTVKATAVPETFSRGYGVTVSGLGSLGGSFSYATADTTARARIADRTQLSENSRVNVLAVTGRAADDTYISASAAAFSASGALLLGVSGSEAVANNESDTIAQVGDYVQLPAGDLNVNATNRSRQISDADGYFVGAVSAGLTFSTAKSQTSTRVLFGKDPIGPGSREGDIILLANSVDENQSFSTAGGGGVVSGSATIANSHIKDSDEKESASVEVADWSNGYTTNLVGAGKVQMEANHLTSFFAGADSVNASVVGGSGARSDVEVDLDTSVDLGKNVSFYANEIDISTSNNIDQLGSPWQNSFENSVKAGAGGALNGSAALSDIRVSKLGATVNIGNNAVLKIDPLADALDPDHNLGEYHIQLDAFTTYNIYDSVVLTVGGALQGAGSDSKIDLDAFNTINLGNGVQLINPVGQVEMGTYSRGFATADASTSVHAVAGVAGGVSDVELTTDNTINIGDNVTIDSFQSTKILAGRSADYFTENYLSATAYTNIYNGAGIAISAKKAANADVTVNSAVNFGDGVDVSSVRDILLESDRGFTYAEGSGLERKKWLGLFSEEDSFGSGNASHGFAKIIFDGNSTLIAGSRYQQTVTIDTNGNITLGEGTEADIGVQQAFSSRASLQQYIDDLKAEKLALESQTGTDTNNDQGSVADNDDVSSDSSGGSTSNSAIASPSRIQQIVDELAFLEPLLGTLPQTTNDAIYIGNMYAAGGDVHLKADTIDVLSGSPSITAHGDPTITVTNNSSKSLILGNMFIPNVGGGSVLVTGAVASNLPNGLAVNENNSGSGSHINIQHKPTVDSGADVILQGDLINLGGVVTVNVEKGNLIQTGSVAAKQMALSVPSGIYLLNNAWQDQPFGFDPESLTGFTSRWKPVSPDQMVMYFVNARYSSEMSSKGEEKFNEWWHGNDYYGNTTARTGHLRVYLNWGFNNSAECKSGSDCEIFYFDNNAGGNSRGNGTWGFDQIKNLQNGLVKTASYQDVKNAGYGPGNGYALNAQLVAINANRIDINGTIRAGNFNEWSVEVGDNFDTAIAQYAQAKGLSAGSRINLSPGQTLIWQESNPNYGKLTYDPHKGFYIDFRRYVTKTVDPQISLVNGGDAGISIDYEVGSGKITLDDVNASGNGFVSIRGYLMSTGEDGKILVDDGRGSIDVINRSTSELVVNDLNAGSQSTGVIRITDLNKVRKKTGTANQYENFSEWYIHEPGQKIKQYVTSASETTYNGVTGIEVGYTEGGKQTYNYQPKKGQLYYLVQREDIKREVNWPPSDAGWVSKYNPLTEWQYDNDNPKVAEWEKWYDGYTSCQSVSAVSCNADGSVSTYLTHILDDRYTWTTGWSSYTTSYSNYYGKDFTSVTWRIDVPYRIGMKATTYVKADHQIKFQFIGAEKGSIDIQSRSDVTLAGNLNNSVGTTKVTIDRSLGSKGSTHDTGSIYMSDTGILNSEKTYLDAAGSLGKKNQSLRMITDHISAVAHSGLANLDITAAAGAVAVQKLHAASTLSVNVDKGLTPYGSGIHLKGDDINITSEFGGIGDVSGNKVMNISSTGLVTLKATGDIALNQSTGNLTVNTIESDAGDIWITLGDGHLENGIGQARYTDEELAYQATVWDKLNLRSDSAGEEAVHGYENQVSSQYHSYWRIKQRLTDDAEFTIDDAYLDAFKQRYKSRQDALNGTDLDLASITREQVTADLKTEFDGLNQWLTDEKTAGNLTAAYSFGDSYNGGYRFDIADNSALYNKLTADAHWTDTQLEIAISAAATQPVTDGYISSRDANISGNNIKLNINKGRVGEDLADMDFDISRTNPNLSNIEKAALLEAGPGDLEITDNGDTIAVSVTQQDPIKINADGHVTLIAGQQIYVESDQGMTLKQVSTSGDVRLATGGAIESVSGADTTIAANNLNLSTKSGHIGTETDPIRLDIEGALRSVAAPSDIWLNHVGGDLDVGAIGAGGLLNLRANGNIANWSENGDNVHLKANGAVIIANNGGNIGASNRALKLNLTGGTLKLEGASAWLEASSAAPIDIAAVNLSGLLDFDTAGDVNLSGNFSADSVDIDVSGAVAATEDISLTTTGNLHILAGTLDTRKATINSGSAHLETSGGQFDSGKITTTNGTLTLLASGDLALYDKIDAKKALLLDAQNIAMMPGSAINARKTAILTAVSALDLRSITTSDKLTLNAATITLREKVESQNNAVFDIDATQQLTVKADQRIKTAGNIDIDAGTVVMEGNSRLESGAALLIDTSSLGMTLAQLQAASMTLSSAKSINLNEAVNVAGVANLMAVNDIVLAAGQTMTTSGNARLKATTIQTHAGSTLDANADLKLETTGSQALAALLVDGLLDSDSSGGPITFNENVTVLGRTEVDAATLVTLKAGRTFKSTQLMTLNSDSFTMGAGSLLDADAGLAITTDKNQQLAQLAVTGLANLASSNGNISFSEQAQAGSVVIKALKGDVSLSTNQRIGSGSTLIIDSDSISIADNAILNAVDAINLSTSDTMQLHHVMSQADILATSGNTLTANGDISAGQTIDLDSGSNMLLEGSISSGGSTDLSSKADITLNGILNAGADLIVHASDRFTNTQTLTAANNINLNNMGGLVRFDADVTATKGNLVFVGNDSLQINGNLTTGGVVNIKALQGDISLAANQTLDSGSTVTLNSHTVTFDDNSLLKAQDAITVTTSDAMTLHHIDGKQSVAVNSGDTLIVNGTLEAGSFIDLDSVAALTLNDNVTAGTDVDITSLQTAVLNGVTKAGNDFKTTTADSLTINNTLTATGNISLDTGGDTATHAAVTSETGNLSFRGDGSLRLNDNLTVAGTIDITALQGDISLAVDKKLVSGSTTTVNSDSVTFAANSILDAGDVITINTSGITQLHHLNGAQSITVNAGDSLTVNGMVDAGLSIDFDSGSDMRLEDTITAKTTLDAHSLGLLTVNGTVDAEGNISFDSAGQATLNADITSHTGRFNFRGDDSLAINRNITTQGSITLNSANETTLSADQALASESLSIDADTFSMGQGSRTETRDDTRIHTRGDMLLSALVAQRDGERAFDLESREGQILGRSDADVHLTAIQPNASGILQAATGIGDPLVIDMPYLSAVTDDGDIYLVARSDLHARLLSAAKGNIYLTTLGNLTIDELLGNPWLLVDGFLAADRMTFDRGLLAARNGTNVTEINLTDTGPLSLFAPEIDVTIRANNNTEVLMPVVADFDWDSHDTSDIKAFINAGVPQLRQSQQLRLLAYDTDQLHVNILQTVNGRVQTTGDMLIDLALSEETLDLVTADLHVNLDNVNPGAKPTETQADDTVTPVDGQFMTPFGLFWIQMDGVNVTTNAQFTRYQPPLLLTYKAPNAEVAVSAAPESFFRLSAEYQNGISNQIDESGGGFVSYINDPLPEELLLAIGDNWLGNLEATAAGDDTEEDEYWLFTGTDAE